MEGITPVFGLIERLFISGGVFSAAIESLDVADPPLKSATVAMQKISSPGSELMAVIVKELPVPKLLPL